jgi:exodeoxyribonuclease VIII
MKYNNVMLDLETFGNGSNAVIVSIGAVGFDENGVSESMFYRNVSAESCVRAGMQMDASTVNWWLMQGDDARKALRLPEPLSLHGALEQLSQWFAQNMSFGACVWGNGATFDNVIIANAYRAVDLERPWPYNKDRCYRTLKALVPFIKHERTGIHHNALHDAKHQAEHAVKLLKALEVLK